MNLESNNIIMKRNVFWSMLEHELPIPLENQKLYYAITGKKLDIGGRHDIKLILDGQMYDAHFRNEGFDRGTFVHSDIVMLKYGVAVQRKLKEIFSISYHTMLDMREKANSIKVEGRKSNRIIIPEIENCEEYLLLCATSNPDVFALECVTKSDSDDIKKDVSVIKEEIFESDLFFENTDDNTGFYFSTAMKKIRKLDKSVGDSLKKIYDYRCQMTGEKVGNAQDALCVEAHHIEPFSESLNNDYTNIIILSPNYHRIVHKAKPTFDRDNLQFIFPNGLKEKVKIDRHLGGNIQYNI